MESGGREENGGVRWCEVVCSGVFGGDGGVVGQMMIGMGNEEK